jgi:uncharacterized protein YjbI with pentapeptide repeats
VVLAIGLVLRSRIPGTQGTPLQFVIALVVLIGLGMVFVVLPTVLVRPHPDLAREQLLKARNDIRTAGIQIVGGTALLAGLVFTNRTLGLNQQGQITDRFTKATDQLGSDKLDIRLGGIYSMERIARDSKNDQGPVMEVLTAFVRDHAPATPTNTASTGTTSTASVGPAVPTDVQAVLTVVGRRNALNDPHGYRPDLTGAYLTSANLTGAYLSGAYLSGANLSGANLSGAHTFTANLTGANLTHANLLDANLSGANLTHANLTGADLSGANLSGAGLSRADLTKASLSRANLTGADFFDADLTGASLFVADLTGAYLSGANLSGANLSGDGLSHADLTNANLTGADLTKANLTKAYLTGADLTKANLTGAHLGSVTGLVQAQVDSAATDPATELPPGIHR